ncbi:CLIPB17 protein [Anopheles sinensis]|uniref:CLIPB17 protein n=1 Tax=Anopheles sinensis TaxID=74873 RepID=A0A084WDP5_ANOSI|nr:CLIPB17 protein [Anopheles sinensis]
MTITGWGFDESRKVTNIMQKGNTQVLQHEEGCVIRHTFCSGGDNQSTVCPGDSGGPYQAQDVYNKKIRYVV